MRRLLLVPALLALLLAGCGTSPADDSELPLVVATTSIWGDVARQIVGDDARVVVLIPIGADAHDYEPTQQQVALILEADLVIANGLGLEEGLHDILESAAADGAKTFEVAPELDPIQFGQHTHENEDTDHEDGDLDPHVWFDPIRVSRGAILIAERLAEVAPEIDWSERALSYVVSLQDLDGEIEDILGGVAEERRKIVTNHDALGYFADRYHFEVIGVVIPGGSTLADPSSAELARLVDEMLEEGVSTIFAETSQPSRLADAVAAEVGEDVAVVELYTESLDEPGSDADTLIGMLRANARAIADALSD
ncbi:MAG TPA: metal ABC transporter substrate-binding protein [Acidimicrobiia bacterium]|nr:metal ABC transporter substrate-binding protein [Acidimicrobiia bacterium]